MRRATLSLIAVSAFAFSFTSCAGQDVPSSKVPSVILNALSSAYPSAANVEWEKKKDLYEAEFELDTVEYTVQLNTTGSVLQSKQDITLADLPEAVKNTINTNYNDLTLDDMEVLEKDGQKLYQVELEARFKSKKVVFDNAGNEQSNASYWD